MRIAIVGDYCDDFSTHRAMLPALEDAGGRGEWVPTTEVEKATAADGIWLAPGSPYASFESVLALVRFARERRVPFLGTCGGFQHVLIEFARNVLAISEADSAEHTGGTGSCVVIPVVCPISSDPNLPKLHGGELVRFLAVGRLRAVMGVPETHEHYFCNFEANPEFRKRSESAGLRVTAENQNGVARAVELDGHPFFVATQYQPQMTSRPGTPHPLLRYFVHLLTESA